MPSYDIQFKRSARKELEALEDPIALRILKKIEGLIDDFRPDGCKKLHGPSDLWRIQAGNYRVAYAIDDHILEVTIFRVRHRREVYDES